MRLLLDLIRPTSGSARVLGLDTGRETVEILSLQRLPVRRTLPTPIAKAPLLHRQQQLDQLVGFENPVMKVVMRLPCIR
jgi:hypothetical protein